jgi:uncharacterized protein YndB with AHSA1/START domain
VESVYGAGSHEALVGPKSFRVVAASMDLRPGGIYHYGLRAPDGGAMWGKFVCREIVRPERIILVNSFSDEAGNLTRHPMSTTWPLETLSTFLFAEEQSRTTVTIKCVPLHAYEIECKTFDAASPGMQQGWTGTLDQLTEYLAKA